ncbi:hypothetical protein ACHAXS_013207 [Conticribra weissflogii]
MSQLLLRINGRKGALTASRRPETTGLGPCLRHLIVNNVLCSRQHSRSRLLNVESCASLPPSTSRWSSCGDFHTRIRSISRNSSRSRRRSRSSSTAVSQGPLLFCNPSWNHSLLPSSSHHHDCKHNGNNNCHPVTLRPPIQSIPNCRTYSSSPILRSNSLATLLSCPEFAPTIFGLSGLLLTTFHSTLHVPYWTSICLTNILVRASLFPLVVQGARTSARFAKVGPEVTYSISSFLRDFRQLKWKGDVASQNYMLGITLKTLRGVFRLHKVNLLDNFKSPLLQIPVFWYFSVDLRRIINGADPELAQQLVESPFFYLADLTEPDPYHALPILSGILLYANVELAVGKRSLAGKAPDKTNWGRVLKDGFQSLAIFIPGFVSQQPSGVQLYLATSMVFTLVQSMGMRNGTVREFLGLPPLPGRERAADGSGGGSGADAPQSVWEGEYVKEFLEYMKKKKEAYEKGERILGDGVMRIGAIASIGTKRESTIAGSPDYDDGTASDSHASNHTAGTDNVQFINLLSFIPPEAGSLTFFRDRPKIFLPGMEDVIDAKGSMPDSFIPSTMPPASPNIIPKSALPPTSGRKEWNDGESNNHSENNGNGKGKGANNVMETMDQMDYANRGMRPPEFAPKELLDALEQKKKNTAPIRIHKKSKGRGKGTGKKGR